VINGNVHALGQQGSDSRVGVTEDGDAVWLVLNEDFFDLLQGVTHHSTETRGVYVEEIIRLADLKFFKKDVVQLWVIVLTSVNENVIHSFVELSDQARKADDLRAGAHNGDDSQFVHS